MSSDPSAGIASRACRWLAGLETGVWAGLTMLGWFAASALWSRHSVWEAPNRLGALFYGPAAWGADPHPAIWAGLAFHLFTSGVVGLLFGCLAREGRNPVRTRLLGVLMGLIWYYLAYLGFWRRLLPPAGLLPPPSLLPAYLVFGLALGGYAGRLRSARRHFLGERPGSGVGQAVSPVGPTG